MIFNSIDFLIFFPIVVLLYFIALPKYKNIVLLIASYYFYMCWNPGYAILIFISTITTFLAAYLIVHSNKRKTALVINIIINLSILFFFKYYNFFNETLANLLALGGIGFSIPKSSFILPAGISFYTFQALGYSIDVYRGDVCHEHKFVNYALFVSFFPQLVAGPIERSKNLLPQFQTFFSFNFERVASGLRLMLWGFFKKVIIADNLSVIVDNVFNNPHDFTGLPILLATIAFAFQIYCDFSGYSDIAIGAARVMGFDIMKNFDRPYHSRSVREFWSRWHISLSTWFKDYVYIPLGGNRVSNARWVINILVTFLVSGLWHGANWTFVIWGGLHGLYQVISRITFSIRSQIVDKLGINKIPIIHSLFQVLITFILTSFAWIFFRANSLTDAVYFIHEIFNISFPNSIQDLIYQVLSMGITVNMLIALVPAVMTMEIVHLLQIKYSISELILSKPVWVRVALYYIIILYIFLYGNYVSNTFIYFQF